MAIPETKAQKINCNQLIFGLHSAQKRKSWRRTSRATNWIPRCNFSALFCKVRTPNEKMEGSNPIDENETEIRQKGIRSVDGASLIRILNFVYQIKLVKRLNRKMSKIYRSRPQGSSATTRRLVLMEDLNVPDSLFGLVQQWNSVNGLNFKPPTNNKQWSCSMSLITMVFCFVFLGKRIFCQLIVSKLILCDWGF